MPALHPIHRVWRLLPPVMRRAALGRATGFLAPRPTQPRPPAQAGLIIGGEIDRASGLGEGARLMHAAIRQLGTPVWTVEAGLPIPGEVAGGPATILPPGAPLILHVNAPQLPAALMRLPRGLLRGRVVVGYWAWELEVPPPSWRAGPGFVHEIWVPSRFTATALESLAPGRIRIVPHPVAARPPRPSGLIRADFGLPEDAIVVLVSFSLASSFERKNPLAAIAAFRMAFDGQADRILVLKILHASHAPADLARLQAAIADNPTIRLETRLLPVADSHALTRCADIVMSLHRSEGFGLVPAEAMLLGRPVIATDYGGSTDFLDATCGMPVGFRLIPARDPRRVFEAPGARWAEADQGEAVAALRRLAGDAGLRRQLGQAALAAGQARLGSEKLAAAIRALGLPTGPAA